MNKRRQVAAQKHRIKAKQLEAKQKAKLQGKKE